MYFCHHTATTVAEARYAADGGLASSAANSATSCRSFSSCGSSASCAAFIFICTRHETAGATGHDHMRQIHQGN